MATQENIPSFFRDLFKTAIFQQNPPNGRYLDTLYTLDICCYCIENLSHCISQPIFAGGTEDLQIMSANNRHVLQNDKIWPRYPEVNGAGACR